MIITCCVCTHCRSVFYVWEDIYCCWLLRLNWKIFCCPRLIANLKSRKQSAVDFPLLVSCTKSFIASLQSNRWSLRNWQLLFTGKTWSSDSTVESWRECVSAYVGVLVCVCACACACACARVCVKVCSADGNYYLLLSWILSTRFSPFLKAKLGIFHRVHPSLLSSLLEISSCQKGDLRNSLM